VTNERLTARGLTGATRCPDHPPRAQSPRRALQRVFPGAWVLGRELEHHNPILWHLIRRSGISAALRLVHLAYGLPLPSGSAPFDSTVARLAAVVHERGDIRCC
jgi:hypothetical protein